jgi:hypothetical protein
LTLASGQILLALDRSVMNASIAAVARALGPTVAGIQSALTLATLVMAMFMIIGGEIGGPSDDAGQSPSGALSLPAARSRRR